MARLAWALLLLACTGAAAQADECAQCKTLAEVAQEKALRHATWLEEQLSAACAQQPDDQARAGAARARGAAACARNVGTTR